MEKIGFVGLGYVGLTFAAIIASQGYDVVGVDIDKEKVDSINRGVLPIHEEGLDKYLADVVSKGLLRATTNYGDLADRDIIFVAVRTPSRPDGSIDLSYVESAARSIGEVLRDKKSYTLIAVKSTVIPGTTRRLARIIGEVSGRRPVEDYSVVSNPEFLREGLAVRDVTNPSRIIIGETDNRGGVILEGFWKNFYHKLGRSPVILRVTAEAAETVKYASNSFLACKISFINTIARICEHLPGCDVLDVAKGMGLDPRIGPHFLRPGLGYGGSCLPKDVKAFRAFAEELGEDPYLLDSIDKVNETQPLRVVSLLEEKLGGLKGRIIVVLGAAFKPGTDDIRESRGLLLARILAGRGARVRLHDPNSKALENARRVLGDTVEYASSLEEALQGAHAAVIATDWPEYGALEPSVYTRLMERPLLYDGRRIYDPELYSSSGVEYYAVGLGRP
ncbi:MAG: UDP-glucose/GDP-mannose dehydrogenase family protein [Desulfurococcales archaeon]|nr:UDP-glucose/GDP-mannose dehydrogenase family protein [Desulfurococcales archaeon]